MLRLIVLAVLTTSAISTSSAQFFAPFPFGPPVRYGIGPVVPVPVVPVPRRSRRFGYTAVVPAPPAVAVAPGSYSSRVDVDGYGGVRIDTPGFKMNVPGFAPPVVSYSVPADSGSTSNSIPSAEMRLAMRDAIARLDAALASHPDGDVWRNYLECQAVAIALDQFEAAASASDQTRLQSELARLGSPYQGVASNPSLAWVTAMDGFQTVHDGLMMFKSAIDNPAPAPSSAAAPKSGPTLAPSLDSETEPRSESMSDAESAPSVLDDASVGEAVPSATEEIPLPMPQPEATTDSQSI
ncbi:MAG: hypothetical protein AAF670_01380 [Planctomycetota bacterium]